MLGALCLISALFFFWDTLTRWPDRKSLRTRRTIIVNLAFAAISVWELNFADSATSLVCLGLGGLVVFSAHTKTIKRKPALLTVVIPVVLCTNLILQFAFGIDLKAALAGGVGRDPTLTGRTVIWDAVLRMPINPLLGAGYESFWVGDRINAVWNLTGPGINEAHNGYLEVYLQLGLVGVVLLTTFLIGCYRTICRRTKPFNDVASFSLALWTIVLFYNMTESAAFRGQLLWDIFLLTAIVIPQARLARRSFTSEEQSAHDIYKPLNEHTVA
jgi:O-antigen ligase